MNRRDFIFNDLKEAVSFELTEEEVDHYFEEISLYIDKNSKSDWQFMKLNYQEALSGRQESCSKNAIDCLFEGDQIQALHEVMDVLSDYNKNSELTYNEAILIKLILEVRSQLKQKGLLLSASKTDA